MRGLLIFSVFYSGLDLFDDEVLAGMGRTGEWLCMNHWDVVPDIVTLGKSFGNGFPVTAMVVKEEYTEVLDKISDSSSYGGKSFYYFAEK